MTPIKLILLSAVVIFLGSCIYGTVVWGNLLSNTKPHIVLIIADDMGWNDVSFHGADQIPTPNIDALAYNGVILNRHYVLPICTPSRTSLLTGRYAIREGMQGFPLKAGEPRGIPLNATLLPEHLRNLGYSTHLVGKWHVGYHTKDYTPAYRGFDTFFGYYNGFITYYNSWIDQEGSDNSVQIGHDLHRDRKESLSLAYSSKYFTDLITDEAEKVIKENGNNKPLFLQISHLAVHASPADEPLEVRNWTEVNETFSYIEDDDRRKYAGMMQAMDESVGRVVTALSEANMLDNSIIIFMADNGAPTMSMYGNTGSNYPLRGIKDTPFEGGVRGAACIFSPLIKLSSRVSNELMHVTDWLPTLYSAAGGNPENLLDIDGLNQWPTIRLNALSPRQSLLVNIDEVRGPEAALIGKHKLVRGAENASEGYYGETGNDPSYPSYNVNTALSSPAGLAISKIKGFISVTERKAEKLREKSIIRCKSIASYANCSKLCLFDVFSDPCETTDLSEKRPKVVKALSALLDQYRKVLMPQSNAPVDPCSYPRYFNGSWMPWRMSDLKYSDSSDACQHPQFDLSPVS